MLELREVNVKQKSAPILNNISLNIRPGNLTALLGSKGAGKTTLLKTISGVLKFNSGIIGYQGIDLLPFSPEKIVAMGISLVPEGRRVFSEMTVLDNLNLGAHFYDNRKFKTEVREQLERVYTFFPILKTKAKQSAGDLNTAEQQMLVIGRALMARPNLLLLDEPSQGLSSPEVDNLFEVIRRINAQGTTILLAEQNASASLSIAHYGYVLEKGRLLLEGPAQDLLKNEKGLQPCIQNN
jgi:branched-chain amino acid transport system ATP-binding protein